MFTKLTDLTTGPLDITVVSKLKGAAGTESLKPFCTEVGVSAALGLRLNEDFVGLRQSKFAGSSVALRGKDSFSGDKESRSIDSPGVVRGAYWSRPSSDGGVGVRGGIGNGRVEDIMIIR